MDADSRYDNRFELVRIELPRWSCLEGGKGAKKIGNTFFKPAGSSPSANMGVLNEDNEPGIKPESQGGQAYSQKERIALVNKTRIPPSQQIDKYADAFGVSRGQAAADLRDWSNRIGGRYPDLDDKFFREAKANRIRREEKQPQKRDTEMTPAQRRAERQAKRESPQRKREIANIQENRLASRIAPDMVPASRGENKTTQRKREAAQRNRQYNDLLETYRKNGWEVPEGFLKSR